MNCEVCQGSEKIRLPLWKRQVVAREDMPVPPSFERMSKEFPCPACTALSKDEMLKVQASEHVDLHALASAPFDLRGASRRAIARAIGEELLRGNMVEWQEWEDLKMNWVTIRGTARVLKPGAMQEVEERRRMEWESLVKRVVWEAQERIQHYGSQVGMQGVPKSVACAAVAEAALAVVNERRRR
jgi:hypothetical protein